jgi:two-component system phosphate regulon sensor histidine kinase PhoR
MILSLRKKFALVQITFLIIVTIAAGILTTYELQRYYKARILVQLQTQAQEVSFLLAHSDFTPQTRDSAYSFLTGFANASGVRLTLIDSIGTVIFDSNVRQDSLPFVENHLYRPEVQTALRKGFGSDQRLSRTVHEKMYYAAKVVDPVTVTSLLGAPGIVRLAIPLEQVEQILQAQRLKIFTAGGFALLLIALLSYWASDWFTAPIQKLARAAALVKKGNLEAHFEHHSQDEIGKLAELLNEMLDKLRADLVQMRKLEKVRSQFLANVSHELRTPIFAIQGYLETLLEGNVTDSEVQKDFIAKTYHQTVRLNNLLADLIDISRIESGEMKLSFRVFAVQPWLTKQVEDLQAKAGEFGINLVLNAATASDEVNALGDQERLTQVILNLAENAIKYNVRGGRVEIGYRASQKEIEIIISDTGHGIPGEHVPRIFERFYRVDKERSRAVGGTGLGLAIVKHIVEAHGSSVTVESEVGKGSVFSFRLKRII